MKEELLEKSVSHTAEVNIGTLVLAMRNYFKARREGNAEEMDEQLRLAEACVKVLDGEVERIKQELKETLPDDAVIEEWDYEKDEGINMPKWYN